MFVYERVTMIHRHSSAFKGRVEVGEGQGGQGTEVSKWAPMPICQQSAHQNYGKIHPFYS